MILGRYSTLVAAGWGTQTTYRTALVASAVSASLTLLTLVSVWTTVYTDNDSSAGADYTVSSMTTYLVAANLLGLLMVNEVDVRLGGEVYRGDHIIGLVRPIGYLLSHAALGLGTVLARLTIVAVPLGLVAAVTLPLAVPSVGDTVFALIAAVLAGALAITVNLMLGLAGFVTANTWGVRYLYGSLQLALSGQVVAIDLLPERLASVIAALPFASMISTPVRILLGRYDGPGQLATLLGQQLLWIGVGATLVALAWRSADGRATAVGG